jgi:hypothetical protein
VRGILRVAGYELGNGLLPERVTAIREVRASESVAA